MLKTTGLVFRPCLLACPACPTSHHAPTDPISSCRVPGTGFSCPPFPLPFALMFKLSQSVRSPLAILLIPDTENNNDKPIQTLESNTHISFRLLHVWSTQVQYPLAAAMRDGCCVVHQLVLPAARSRNRGIKVMSQSLCTCSMPPRRAIGCSYTE